MINLYSLILIGLEDDPELGKLLDCLRIGKSCDVGCEVMHGLVDLRWLVC